MATAVFVSATNNAEIDGLLSGRKWTGTITYSFPDAGSDYPAGYPGGSGEPTAAGFSPAPGQMQAAVTYAVGLINSYTNANIQYAGTNGADIMVAQSPAANPTSYAYYPSGNPSGGDVWFGTQYNYSLASLGNYYFATALHEFGHALGLKHGQETGGVANVAVPTAHDDSEYTVMSYRSYVGGPTTGYTNEAYGYPQTYMANDILALQTLYGANYSTQSGNTVYQWSPTTGQQFINGVGQPAPGGGAGGSANRIFETVWDGGGIDTYDLSNYTTNLTLNLNPGASSVFSSVQIANLGNGHYASGNVYNAYLYNNDARSYIDNAIGGSGNDTIIGNAIANSLTGGAGVDSLWGGGGADTFVFGPGDSSAAAGQHDRINDFAAGDKIDLSAIDAISGTAGVDLFRFLGTAAFDGGAGALVYAYNSATNITTLSGDTDGDRVANFAIDIAGNVTLSASNVVGAQAAPPVIIESIGNTSLVQSGGTYYLNPVAGGTGPTVKYLGSVIAAGQFYGWAPIGVEKTASGYQIAWKMAGADQYTIWNADNNGNYVSSVVGTVSGSSAAFVAQETAFQQDLNGDGTVGGQSAGPSPIVIEAVGSTKLDQIGTTFYLDAVASGAGSGPTLKYLGSLVVSGQFYGWSPIGVEKTANGYEVAWKLAGADQYTIWNADNNGNYISSVIGVVPGSDTALEARETLFNQDLNSDGIIGLPAVTIEASGVTKLDRVSTTFHLDAAGSNAGTGPTLKYLGSLVVSGQFYGWSPIGAEKTASGYTVAWKMAGADQYTIWNADSNGNYVSSVIGVVPGSDTAFQAQETLFNQDLNGDGVIGAPSATIIEASGVTKLDRVSTTFYLDAAGSNAGTGPTLKYLGSLVVSGQFYGWSPIGAEKTASGYTVAWKMAGADQYTIWNADNNGNYVSSVVGVVSGSNAAFTAQETVFQQDLNNDGVIGTPTGGAPAAAATAGQSLDAFAFRSDLGMHVAGEQQQDHLTPGVGNGFVLPWSVRMAASMPQGFDLSSLMGPGSHDQGALSAAAHVSWVDLYLHNSHFVL